MSGKELIQNDPLARHHVLEKERLLTKTNPNLQLADTYAATKMGNPMDLVALASFIDGADQGAASMVGGKLEQISEQIKHLQAQARKVLEDGKRNVQLNHARCNMRRQPGKTYHLYEPPNGSEDTYFSMLSPEEWGHERPDKFLGSYRLEYDMSWTPVEEIRAREQRRTFDPMMLGLGEENLQGLAKVKAIL